VNPKIAYCRLFWFVLVSFAVTFACSGNTDVITYEGEDFTFSAQEKYETKEYETPIFDPTTNNEHLLFSNIGHYPYFSILRQRIPPGSNLDTVFADYMAMTNTRYTYNYQFISQNTITVNDRTAIEFVHREFIGEPYVQTREIWMEYNGWAYSLVCGSPAVSTPGAVIPISDQCFRFVEGFKFK
jgi:hypothetical protein